MFKKLCRKYYYFTPFIASLIPACSYAFFCPNNFNQIDIGYTEAQVLQLCGKPMQKETKEVKGSGPEEWNYFMKQTISSLVNYQTVGTLKMQIVFDSNNNALNITVNGIGVGSTAICGPLIQLNDSKDKIKSACGAPAYINQPTSTSMSIPSSQVTTYTYNSNPAVVLTFEKGVLTKKE